MHMHKQNLSLSLIRVSHLRFFFYLEFFCLRKMKEG